MEEVNTSMSRANSQISHYEGLVSLLFSLAGILRWTRAGGAKSQANCATFSGILQAGCQTAIN